MIQNKYKWLMLSFLCIVFAFSLYYSFFSTEESPEKVVVEESAPVSIHVYVSGAVDRPGVYMLPEGSHAQDAVIAAGKPLPYADLDAVNLATMLHDGDHVMIPYQFHPPESDLEVKLVNVNFATQKELEELPGVGPETAKKIIEYRSEHGAFISVDDVKSVHGIGEGKFEQFRKKITV